MALAGRGHFVAAWPPDSDSDVHLDGRVATTPPFTLAARSHHL